MSGEALLSVRGLQKHFPRRRGAPWKPRPEPIRAIDGIDFEIGVGESLGLVGESGSGKSTTAYCVLALLRPTAGEISFLGHDLTKERGKRLRRLRREMQIVFQDPYASLNPRMRVDAIVAEPLEVQGGATRRARRARVLELLDTVGLDADAAKRYPHEFSGGQQQRIAIARALASSPRLIVCDEPVSALDVSVQAQIINLLKDLRRDRGLSYLFISHDLAVVRAVSDRIAVMQGGRIVETGPADRLCATPTHEYTRALLAAVPVPDPRRMRARKNERRRRPYAA